MSDELVTNATGVHENQSPPKSVAVPPTHLSLHVTVTPSHSHDKFSNRVIVCHIQLTQVTLAHCLMLLQEILLFIVNDDGVVVKSV